MFEEDLSVFFEDFALPVTWQGVSVARGGILDQPQEYVNDDGDVMLTDYTLQVRTSEFGRMRMGHVVDVGGIRYRVRSNPKATTDGAFSDVGLMRLRAINFGTDEPLDEGDTGQPDTDLEP